MNGTAVYGERVVIVEVRDGNVRLKTGRIVSNGSSHVHADNHQKTVVWGDREFRPLSDVMEDAHEKDFEVDDIHLLAEKEVALLQDRDTAAAWFGSIYQDRLVGKIHRALQRLHAKVTGC